MPFPREDVTPPVTNMYFAICLGIFCPAAQARHGCIIFWCSTYAEAFHPQVSYCSLFRDAQKYEKTVVVGSWPSNLSMAQLLIAGRNSLDQGGTEALMLHFIESGDGASLGGGHLVYLLLRMPS